MMKFFANNKTNIKFTYNWISWFDWIREEIIVESINPFSANPIIMSIVTEEISDTLKYEVWVFNLWVRGNLK